MYRIMQPRDGWMDDEEEDFGSEGFWENRTDRTFEQATSQLPIYLP